MRIIAHRGASAAAPENTMAAFALAKRLGADAMELDARICGSGEVVVFHDRELSRLTGTSGVLRRTPLEAVRALRVRGEAIPTLEEVLLSPDRPPGLVIELKSDRWNDVVLAAKVARLLERQGAAARGPVVISSFNPLLLHTLRRIAPRWPRAILVHAKLTRPLRKLWLAPMVAPAELHLEACMIDARVMARARKAGRAVVAWTVNERAEGERLRALGVDGLITDVPDAFIGG